MVVALLDVTLQRVHRCIQFAEIAIRYECDINIIKTILNTSQDTSSESSESRTTNYVFAIKNNTSNTTKSGASNSQASNSRDHDTSVVELCLYLIRHGPSLNYIYDNFRTKEGSKSGVHVKDMDRAVKSLPMYNHRISLQHTENLIYNCNVSLEDLEKTEYVQQCHTYYNQLLQVIVNILR